MQNNLNGVAILRFTKAFKAGGGIEQYINDLDKELLKRNEITIIRTYINNGKNENQNLINKFGKGKIVYVPLNVCLNENIGTERDKTRNNEKNILRKILYKTLIFDPYKETNLTHIKKLFWEKIIYNHFLLKTIFKRILDKKYPQPRMYDVKNIRLMLQQIHNEYNIQLIIMHSLGTIDSLELINEAKILNIPYLYINHFSNTCLTHYAIRSQIIDASAIASVTSVNYPKKLKNKIKIVYDGIDLNFFNPIYKKIEKQENRLIIYPARITPNKGQKDLIFAFLRLKKMGFNGKVIFAGRVDCVEYENELKSLVKKYNIENHIRFLGQINRIEIRDWYSKSSIMAFPTYHQEGLPRILIEAQSMKLPTVSYNIGGIKDAVVNGVTGYLVKKGNIEEFSSRLYEIISNEQKMIEMGEAARKFIEERFSLETLADRHEKIYLMAI